MRACSGGAAYPDGMGSEGSISPTPHYYKLQGRAAEIARSLGSPIGGAEHLFLGMLHDGGWPVSTLAEMVELAEVEGVVRNMLNDPAYLPPLLPPHTLPRDFVQPWGFKVARELGDSHVGAEHAFLEMIRRPGSVPARALAQVTDLSAVEAAVLAAMSQPARVPAGAVVLPDSASFDGPLQRALIDALAEDQTFGWNVTEGGVWVEVLDVDGSPLGEAVTREVLNRALASLGRPALA